MKLIEKGYIPIPHDPRSVPTGCTPRSISVAPDAGNILSIPRLGILIDDEQSKVPFVVKRRIVLIPALATLFRG